MRSAGKIAAELGDILKEGGRDFIDWYCESDPKVQRQRGLTMLAVAAVLLGVVSIECGRKNHVANLHNRVDSEARALISMAFAMKGIQAEVDGVLSDDTAAAMSLLNEDPKMIIPKARAIAAGLVIDGQFTSN